MPLQKSRYDVRAERERYAAIVRQPASDVFIRIRPEEVTKDAFGGTKKKKENKYERDEETKSPPPSYG